MRCKACNALLSDREAINKDEHGYIDLCNRCLSSSDGLDVDLVVEDELWDTIDEEDVE